VSKRKFLGHSFQTLEHRQTHTDKCDGTHYHGRISAWYI